MCYAGDEEVLVGECPTVSNVCTVLFSSQISLPFFKHMLLVLYMSRLRGGLVINLATVHELCDVTCLARTALIDLVYGDILRLPGAQITEFYEFMSNRL